MVALAAAACLAMVLAPDARAQADLSRSRLVTLPNGLRLLLAPDSTALPVEVGCWFDVGPRDEKPGLSGITAVLGRLMLRGAGREDPSREVAAEGGTAGSFATPDLTCFYETLPPGSLELGFRIEAERMRSMAITPADLEAERQRVRLGRAESAPGACGLQRLYAALYPGHPYRLPASGTDAGLARITVRDCEDDFRSRFAPNRALVTVVGRFDPAQAQRLAKTWLEPLPRRPAPPAGAPPRGGPPVQRRVSEPFDFDLRLLFVGWRAPGRSDPDAVALDLLGRVLAYGSESRLSSGPAGADRGLLFPQGGYDGRRDGGLFYAYGALRPGADSAAVEKDLLMRIEKLALEPVSADELERAKRQAESGSLFGWQTVHGRGVELGAAQIVEGDFHGAWNRLERIRQATVADLQRVATKVLRNEGRCVMWTTPRGRALAAPAAPGAGR